MNENAFQMGQEAYIRGDVSDDNPFDPNIPEFDEWNEGYTSGDQFLNQTFLYSGE